MAHNFFRQVQQKQVTEEREVFMNVDMDMREFKDAVIPETEEEEENESQENESQENESQENESQENEITNTVKGLQKVSLGLEGESILVPPKRTQFKELELMLKSISNTMNQILKQTGDIEKTILLTESNNNISDSDTKRFIEETINNSLEQFKNFITTKFEKKDNKDIENLGDNDIVIIVNNAPSKQMLKINSDTANEVLNDILGKGGNCYITDNMNKTSLSQQIREIEQTKILERKEDANSRKQRINISFDSPDENIESDSADSDKEKEIKESIKQRQRININFESEEENDKESEMIEKMLETLNKK